MKSYLFSYLSWQSLFGMLTRPLFAWLLLTLTGALSVRHWIWMPVLISGDSMLPTLRNGQIVGLNKLAYAVHSPRRGDIVVIWTGKEYMTKRVVGLPREELAAHNGEFYLNGAKLTEPYVKLPKSHNEIRAGIIESNCFVVAGDYRGPEGVVAVVSQARIIGRIIQIGHRSP